MSDLQRRGSTKLSVDADTFEDLSGTWQAILKAEQNRPDLRIVGNAYFAEMEHIGGIPTPLRSASGRPPRARPIDSTVPRRPALRGPCPGGDDDLDERGTESGQRVGDHK